MRSPRTRKGWAVWLPVAMFAVATLAARPVRALERDESSAAESGANSNAADAPIRRLAVLLICPDGPIRTEAKRIAFADFELTQRLPFQPQSIQVGESRLCQFYRALTIRV